MVSAAHFRVAQALLETQSHNLDDAARTASSDMPLHCCS